MTLSRPTAPEAAALIRELHNTPGGSAGCCLHVVVEDGNIANSFLDAAEIETVREIGHPLCIRLAEMLSSMSKTQRRKAIALATAIHPNPIVAIEIRADQAEGRSADEAAGIREGWHRGWTHDNPYMCHKIKGPIFMRTDALRGFAKDSTRQQELCDHADFADAQGFGIVLNEDGSVNYVDSNGVIYKRRE